MRAVGILGSSDNRVSRNWDLAVRSLKASTAAVQAVGSQNGRDSAYARQRRISLVALMRCVPAMEANHRH